MNKYNIYKNINPNIFRGYDIRAIYNKDLNEDIAYTIGLSFGSYIREKGYEKCLVGHNNRTLSETLSDALIEGITSTGIDVVFLGLCTTPMYYYAQKKLNIDPGVMITASHNPKEYNGFKISFSKIGNACGKLIEDFKDFTYKQNFITKNKGKIINENIKEAYLQNIKNSIDLGTRKIKVVVDCGNGTGSIIIKDILKEIGY